MTHNCPRCGYPLISAKSDNINIAGGLISAMIYAGIKPLEFKKCGKIKHSEFNKETRNKVIFSTASILLGVIFLFH